MGAAALSLLNRRSLQNIWNLHPSLRVGAAHHQLRLFGNHNYSCFPDCATLLRSSRRALVGGSVGAESVGLVLVGALDLGYDLHAVCACADFSGVART